jgi:hypothetical protein
VGQHDALGFSPFGIDSFAPARTDGGPREESLAASYQALAELMPLITKFNGTGKMAGILQDKDLKESIVLGDYRLDIEFPASREQPAATTPARQTPGRGYGLVINTGRDEYLVVGSGFTVRFAANSPGPRIGRIGYIDEGSFADDKWIPGRRLNGDENGGGARMYFPAGRPMIQKIKLYRHD